jgi:hypothetical protein
MPNHKKATDHHGKAGKALASKDFKLAAHHMGHALSALRESATDEPDAMPDENMEAEESPVPPNLRGRLAKMKPKM